MTIPTNVKECDAFLSQLFQAEENAKKTLEIIEPQRELALELKSKFEAKEKLIVPKVKV